MKLFPLLKRPCLLSRCLFVLLVLFSFPQVVQAEGSADFILDSASTDYRPYLDDSSATTGGISRNTIIRVYAESGETINLGSSANGIGNGRIRYTDPNGTTTTCPTGTDVGEIDDRDEEVNGPNGVDGTTNGYTPCTVTVTTTGVWEIDFDSPDPTGNPSPPAITVGTKWPTQGTGNNYITAWDVTVSDTSNNSIDGRVFTNYFPLNLGAFGSQFSLGANAFVLTDEGYIYKVDLNGLQPFGFIFFANKRGFVDGSGDPIYESIDRNPSSGGIGNDIVGLDDFTRTHRLFINEPSNDVPFNLTPEDPPIPQNFQFQGEEGTNNQAGTNPLGGNFSFDNPSVSESSYIITLDIDQDGTFGNNNDRILIGLATPGNNTVFWNGLDGDGNPVPASNQPYGAQIQLTAGEVHFPFIDVESNSNGLIVIRQNDPPTAPEIDDDLLYYDDSNLGSRSGVTAPVPIRSLSGLNSDPNGVHEFSGGGGAGWGDKRGIDSWTYYPSSEVVLTSSITIKEADLKIEKTHTPEPAFAGQPITFTLTVTNDGPSDITGATVTDTFPSELSNITWSCQITNGNGNCVDANGTGDINATLDLENGAVAEYTIEATVNSGVTASFDNTAEVERPNDVNDPDDTNNSATDTVTLTDQPQLKLLKRITAVNGQTNPTNGNDLSIFNNDPSDDTDDYPNWPTPKDTFLAGGINGGEVEPGDIVEYTIYYISSGATDARNVTICDLIPDNQTFIRDAFNAQGVGTNLGIAALIRKNPLDNADPNEFLTNLSGDDEGRFLAAGIDPPNECDPNNNLSATDNTGGLIIVDVVENPAVIPAATSSGTPPESYGFIRFRTKVD